MKRLGEIGGRGKARALLALVVLGLIVAGATAKENAAKAEDDAGKSGNAKSAGVVRIVLIGDSTVTDKKGWGGALAGLFDDTVKVFNHAKGGRSSKSYLAEGHLKKAMADRPDYVFIQFGHNDCRGKGPKRETDPATTYLDHMRTYVREARKAGAQPILVTSVERRNFDEKGRIKPSLAPYAAAVLRLGKEMDVPVIDLHARSIELFQRLGAAGDRMQPKGDRTHFNANGGKAIAQLVVDELRKADPELAKRLR